MEADPLPSVAIHGTQLQSLFQNLIGNALKYRRPEVAPVVKITARRQNGIEQDDFWLYGVADNGIGIDPAFREQIFGLFKLNAFTQATNIQVPESVWPFANASLSTLMAASGLNPKSARDAASTSRSLGEGSTEEAMDQAPRCPGIVKS